MMMNIWQRGGNIHGVDETATAGKRIRLREKPEGLTVFGEKKKRSVTIRFQDKLYVLKEGYFFKPIFTVTLEGDLVGKLETRQDFSIEVVSID